MVTLPAEAISFCAMANIGGLTDGTGPGRQRVRVLIITDRTRARPVYRVAAR